MEVIGFGLMIKTISKFSPTQYSDYDSQWIGGYEELYPNDKVELINGKHAPDHGELWSSSWEITSNTRTSLEIKCEGYFSNSMIIKKFELIGNKLFVNFEIKEIKFKKLFIQTPSCFYR